MIKQKTGSPEGSPTRMSVAAVVKACVQIIRRRKPVKTSLPLRKSTLLLTSLGTAVLMLLFSREPKVRLVPLEASTSPILWSRLLILSPPSLRLGEADQACSPVPAPSRRTGWSPPADPSCSPPDSYRLASILDSLQSEILV